MKQSILLLFALTLLACSENTSKDNPQTTKAKPVKTVTSNNIPDKKEACDYLDADQLQGIFDWGEVEITEQTMMSLERYKDLSVCVVNILGPDATLQLRLSWKNENGIKNKVLEQQYQNRLTNGEKVPGGGMATYEEISNANGQQVIFSAAEGMHGYVNYALQKRFDNTAEINLSYSQIGGDKADILQKLQTLMKEIQ